MKRSGTIFLLLGLSGQLAWAGAYEILQPSEANAPGATCTPIRLKSDALGEPRRQSDSQWCFAFLVADLLSWELGTRVSAADVGLSYNDNVRDLRARKDNRRSLGRNHSEMSDGGDPAEAIDIILRKGACRESDMPSQDFLLDRGNGMGEELHLITMIAELGRVKEQWDRSRDLAHACRSRQGFREIFPWLDWNGIMDVMESAQDKEFISALQARNCDLRRLRAARPLESVVHSPHPSTPWNSPAGSRLVRRKIDELLESGRPAGLMVTSEFVGSQEADAWHGLSIVGRRLGRDGVCEYLVRDSNDFCDPSIFTCEANGDRWTAESKMAGKVKKVYSVRSSERRGLGRR